MLDAITKFFFEDECKPVSGAHTADELDIAAAGLLVEAAMMDGHFDEAERARIRTLCVDRLGVAADAVDSLITEAERRARDSVDVYGFMRVVMRNFEHDAQVMLIELLWSVAYADGAVDEHESALIRKIVGMTSVTDRESGEARKKAAAARRRG